MISKDLNDRKILNWAKFIEILAIIKNTKTEYLQGCGGIGPLLHCWWKCKIDQTLKNSLAVPQRVKYIITVKPSNSFTRYIPMRNENISHRNWYMNVYSTIIHKGQKVEIAHVYQNKQMDKQSSIAIQVNIIQP